MLSQFGLGLGGLTRAQGVGANPVLSLLAKGADGFWFDSRNLFQDQANVLADDADEVVGQALEKHEWNSASLASIIAAASDLVTNGGFDSDTVWSKGADWAIAAGKATKTPGSSTAIAEGVTVTAGKLYRIVGTISGRTVGSCTPRFTGGSTVNGPSVSVNGQFVVYIMAASGNNSLSFVASGTFDGSLDDVSMKLIPGNHGFQATLAAKPKLQLNGIKPLMRFDGTDDQLGQPLVLGASATVLAKVNLTAAGSIRLILGAADAGTTNRFQLQVNASGQRSVRIGSGAAVDDGGASILDTVVTFGARYNGSIVELLGSDGAVLGSQGQSGAPTTTRAPVIGAFDNAGSFSNFWTGDVYQLVMVKGYFATSAEFAAAAAYLNAN